MERIIVRYGKYNSMEKIIVYYICLDEHIDDQAFLYMPDSLVKELIPSVGQRFHFLSNRKILLQRIDDTSIGSSPIVVR